MNLLQVAPYPPEMLKSFNKGRRRGTRDASTTVQYVGFWSSARINLKVIRTESIYSGNKSTSRPLRKARHDKGKTKKPIVLTKKPIVFLKKPRV